VAVCCCSTAITKRIQTDETMSQSSTPLRVQRASTCCKPRERACTVGHFRMTESDAEERDAACRFPSVAASPCTESTTTTDLLARTGNSNWYFRQTNGEMLTSSISRHRASSDSAAVRLLCCVFSAKETTCGRLTNSLYVLMCRKAVNQSAVPQIHSRPLAAALCIGPLAIVSGVAAAVAAAMKSKRAQLPLAGSL